MSSGKEFDERVTIRHSSFYIWNFFRLKPLRAKIDHGRNPVKIILIINLFYHTFYHILIKSWNYWINENFILNMYIKFFPAWFLL